jgi:hypothetical protein
MGTCKTSCCGDKLTTHHVDITNGNYEETENIKNENNFNDNVENQTTNLFSLAKSRTIAESYNFEVSINIFKNFLILY